MNKWILIGNLTEDPKLFFSEKGTAICIFTMAAESGYGKYKKTTYVQAVTYGKMAEVHAKHLSKGSKVAVTGVGYQKKNTNKGRTYYNLQVITEEVQYLNTYKKDGDKEAEEAEDYTPPALDDDDFEVPF